MQVYLPDDLYSHVKRRGLRASELLQAAIRAELRRRRLSAEADRYVDALIAEVGEPSTADVARAGTIVRRIRRKRTRRAS